MHRDPNDFGENIAVYSAAPGWPEATPEMTVDGWAAEVACWDYDTFGKTDSCDLGCAADLNANGCGHYTQLVWRETARVGCGMAQCSSGQFNTEI